MNSKENLESIANKLAEIGFKIGAIKFNPEVPFTWASGLKSPIYNDNRMFLFHPDARKLIIDGLEILATDAFSENENNRPDVVAGTSTAGIPHGYGLAERLGVPFIYVRDKPKGHGLQNQIEGIDASSDLSGKKVLLIEDLVSTGGSSVNAVQAIRNAKGEINYCFSIFSYGFPKANEVFGGTAPYNKDGAKLSVPCNFDSILRYPTLLEFGIKNNYLKENQENILKDWAQNPEAWSEKFQAES